MSFIQTLFGCCLGHPDAEEDDERTHLLVHDTLPEAPVQPAGRTTEQQLAQKKALRHILNVATERFVNIDDAAPFSLPPSSSNSSASSRSSSPLSFDSTPRADTTGGQFRHHASATDRSSAAWRPTDDGLVRVVHLGTHFEPHGAESRRSAGGAHARPMSSHSLKTLPRGGGGGGGKGRPSPLATESDDDGTEGQHRYSTIGSRYGTMGSYRTAREEEGSEERDEGAMGRGSARKGDGRPGVKDLWASEGGLEGTEEEENGEDEAAHQEELAKALTDLEDSMISFQLAPVGPVVEDLNDDA